MSSLTLPQLNTTQPNKTNQNLNQIQPNLNLNQIQTSTKSKPQPNPNLNQIQTFTKPNLIVVLGNQTKLN